MKKKVKIMEYINLSNKPKNVNQVVTFIIYLAAAAMIAMSLAELFKTT